MNAPHVLLIQDEPVVRDFIQELEFLGYECAVAADGPSGLELFEGQTWDLVITDLTLPGMTGWHVVEAVRKRIASLPIIVISGADHTTVRAAATERAVSVLFKPFGLDALRSAVVSALWASVPPSFVSGEFQRPPPNGGH
jgi:CheY-like chemotaxis protein